MTYAFDRAKDFTLLTANEQEVREIQEFIRAADFDRRDAAIWVIEGDSSDRIGRHQVYRLREVFHPRAIRKATPNHSPGAKRTFRYLLQGDASSGQRFTPGFVLNREPWFEAFFELNGNFAFGLDHLRDPEVVTAFREIVRSSFHKGH